MKLERLPFHIGATEQAANPKSLPNELHFNIVFNKDLGILSQVCDQCHLDALEEAYKLGMLIGTPLQDSGPGKKYFDDFVRAVTSKPLKSGARVLEIGAGIGSVAQLLANQGCEVTAIEPGEGYQEFWTGNKVRFVKDYFPSDQVTEKFDLIYAYAVLEHVYSPLEFLQSIRNQLTGNGLLVLAVPDCGKEIELGDPSILYHEHISYFDAIALNSILGRAGFKSKVERSGIGRCLYATATLSPERTQDYDYNQTNLAESYSERCEYFTSRVRRSIRSLSASGSLGIFCPSRGLALLDQDIDCRFFDDDRAMHGKYLPPFHQPIESRLELKRKPVDNLVIMSRTFGDQIRISLKSGGYDCGIFLIDELL